MFQLPCCLWRVRKLSHYIPRVINHPFKYQFCFLSAVWIYFGVVCNKTPVVFCTGDAGRVKRHWWGLCSESVEERCHPAGWWCGLHYDWETHSSAGQKTPLPDPTLLLLSDQGKRPRFCSRVSSSSFKTLQYKQNEQWRQSLHTEMFCIFRNDVLQNATRWSCNITWFQVFRKQLLIIALVLICPIFRDLTAV